MYRILSYYQIVTPESAEQGDYAESGAEGEDTFTADDCADDGLAPAGYAAGVLIDAGASEPSSSRFHPGVWYSTVDPERDCRTGAETTYTYHLKGFTPAEELEAFALVTGKALHS